MKQRRRIVQVTNNEVIRRMGNECEVTTTTKKPKLENLGDIKWNYTTGGKQIEGKFLGFTTLEELFSMTTAGPHRR